MICNKCDPAGHIAGEEKEFLRRMRESREEELRKLHLLIGEMVAHKAPHNRFTGERVAAVLRDLDAIQNLSIVVG